AEPDTRRDGLARALERVAGAARAAAETERRCQLAGNEVELRPCTSHASLVVAPLGVVELAVQLAESDSIVVARTAVEHRVVGAARQHRALDLGVACLGRRTGRGDQVGDVNL